MLLSIHPGALGDVVLFAQLLAALRRRSTGPVVLVAGGEKARLLAGLGAINRAVDFDALPMHEVFSDAPPGQCRLPGALGLALGGWQCPLAASVPPAAPERSPAVELLVSCFAGGNAPAEARLAALCGAGRAVFLPIRPPPGSPGHLVDCWAQSAGVAEVPAPRWHVPEAWRGEAARLLTASGLPPGRPYLLIHPGSGSPRKCWPLERFIELAGLVCRRVSSDGGLSPVFVLGPVELDRSGGRPPERLGDYPVIAAPSLPALAGLLAGAAAYLGNDSGPSHLAAAVGAPAVALFGPANAAHFAPRGRRVRIVQAPDLATLAVDQVALAVEESLRGGGMSDDE